ncbi:MAG: hypothetical protein B0W54_19925 [Cellvibrio sp. 79]|nr:MAG: hypothetical protein B0W54_19925 [Cellvibrio sp. 79]
MDIRLAQQTDLELFFQYLDLQLQSNGAGDSVVFQPVSRDESRVNETIRSKKIMCVDELELDEATAHLYGECKTMNYFNRSWSANYV